MAGQAALQTASPRRDHRACRVVWGVLALAALCLAGPAQAEPPPLPGMAAAPGGFAPPGWQIAQQLAVDLDRDGRPDAVLLLQPDAPAPPPGTGRSPERVLAVLLQRRGAWVLLAQNARLVPQLDLATQEDPLANGELATDRPGHFSLSLGLSSTAGSYASAVLRYRFRWDPRCVRLVGYDQLQTQRATLDTQDTHIDFLSGVVQVSSGNAQSDATTRRRSRLADNPRRCLAALDNALNFQPLGAPR